MNVEKEFSDFFQRFWNWRLRNAPEFATSIGAHQFNDRLDEMSLSSYKRRENEGMIFLDELSALQKKANDSKISDSTKLNADLLEADLRQFLHGLSFKTFLCPINILEGVHLDFPRLLSWMEMKTEQDFRNILTRLQLFPQQVDETIRLLEEGIRTGVTMHKVSVSTLPNTLIEISEQKPENVAHFKPFKTKPDSIELSTWNNLLEQAKQIISERVLPSYKRLGTFLEDIYMEKTRSCIGASSLPKGKEFYNGCLKFHTTTDMTPQQIHDKGIEEVERITKRMEQVKMQVKYQGTLAEFREYLRTDSKFKFKSKEDILQHYQNVCDKIATILPNYFARLAKDKLVIEAVPDEVAAGFPGAYYLAPSEDGSRPGTFLVNTHNPTNRNKYEAASLALHEAQPGHHLQTSLTMDSGALVPFRRFLEDRKYFEPPGRFAMNSAYIEGWGLYSEYLGEEMGLYEDPYDLFGRLSHEMLRACRLVVDTGMHALGWSRQQAIDYMMQHTASSDDDVIAEIDRYISWPGQACGYKIGEIKIKELRKMVENGLGDMFDVRMFHDFVASIGGLPLDVLEVQLKKFVQEQK